MSADRLATVMRTAKEERKQHRTSQAANSNEHRMPSTIFDAFSCTIRHITSTERRTHTERPRERDFVNVVDSTRVESTVFLFSIFSSLDALVVYRVHSRWQVERRSILKYLGLSHVFQMNISLLFRIRCVIRFFCVRLVRNPYRNEAV